MADSTLAALTAATAGTGGLYYGTQSGADRKFTMSAAGAVLAEAADAAAQVTALGVLPLSGGSLTGAVSVPTAASASLANARLNGVMFGASPAAANVGISSFNNGLSFYANAEHSVYHDILHFRFTSTVWLSWSATSATAGPITELSGGLASATLQMGKASATPIDQTFQGPNGSGTNIAGGDIRIAPGQSTGNATPATVVLQGTAAGASGTTAQTLVDVLTVVREGVIRITNIPTSSAGLSTGDIYSNAGILTIV
jgi:hypothetical protein